MDPEHNLRIDVLAAALLLLCFFIARTALHSAAWHARMRGLPFPPGPRRLPFIGNLLDMPKSQAWCGFRDLSLRYGDTIYLEVMRQPIIVLGSASAISEFMEKRASNTSDRLVTPIVRLTGIDRFIGLIPYGPIWRAYRRALWSHFHSAAVRKYHPTQRAAVHKFLIKLLRKPREFKQHARFAVAATTLKLSYGIDLDDENHKIIGMIDAALQGSAQALVPGKYLVEALPLLAYVPTWFPGAAFQKTLATWRRECLQMKEELFKTRNTAFTDEVLPGNTPMVDTLMAQSQKIPADINVEALVKDVGAVTFVAGTDTASSTIYAAIVALSMHPEVQQKAQTELDAVLGRNRLPDFSDRDNFKLVYVQAIIMESLRWYNVTPLGIPHRTIADDEIRGYFVPAGATLVPNIWACMNDPVEYPDPTEFRPERFIRDGRINPAVRDPSSIVFGFGRRICPGRYFAKDMLFLTIASLLHTFEIGPPVDDLGRPCKVQAQDNDGFMSYLEDCNCNITPRSSETELLHSLGLTVLA